MALSERDKNDFISVLRASIGSKGPFKKGRMELAHRVGFSVASHSFLMVEASNVSGSCFLSSDEVIDDDGLGAREDVEVHDGLGNEAGAPGMNETGEDGGSEMYDIGEDGDSEM